MADTYRAKVSNIVFGSGKSLIALWNGAGSADILKVNRIYFINNQVGIALGTGVLVELRLAMITTHTTSIKIFPQKLRTSAADLDANVVASSGSTVTEATQKLRRILWSGDEPSQAELNTDTLGLIPNFNIIWDTGYNSTVLEPITLNASQGVHVVCSTSTTATYMGDIIMEFTK
jgi:hypothetical protein